jgi:hypothetical protein
MQEVVGSIPISRFVAKSPLVIFEDCIYAPCAGRRDVDAGRKLGEGKAGSYALLRQSMAGRVPETPISCHARSTEWYP